MFSILRNRQIACMVVLASSLTITGCRGRSPSIEKTSEAWVIPAHSKEVYLYNLLEGISARTDAEKEVAIEAKWNPNAVLEHVKLDLDSLKKPRFHFFGWSYASKDGDSKEDSVFKHCRVDEARFFIMPDRKRQLCMDRRITILDRDAFAKSMNDGWTELLRKIIEKNGVDALLESLRKDLEDRKDRPPSILAFTIGLDAASSQRIKTATEKGFRWWRFEDQTFQIVIPATLECAKRIVADPKSRAHLKELRKLSEPIDLSATDEGLHIVYGGKDQAVRSYTKGSDQYQPSFEKALFEHTGSPKAIMIGGKAANAHMLIEQFIAEKRKK